MMPLINATVEMSGDWLAKKKQWLNIDGAASLLFAVVAARQSGKPLDPEKLGNYREPEADSKSMYWATMRDFGQ
jgi:hypothetical protein